MKTISSVEKYILEILTFGVLYETNKPYKDRKFTILYARKFMVL